MIHMTPSPWLYDFLKQYEKFRPTAYSATADERRRNIWTIAWGHTKGVKEGDTCDTSQGQVFLVEDVAEAVTEVCRLVNVPVNQCQFDAMASLVFDCGPAPLERTMGSLLNTGNYAGAAAQFPRWDRQSGVELPGLEGRRIAEMKHFLTPDANS